MHKRTKKQAHPLNSRSAVSSGLNANLSVDFAALHNHTAALEGDFETVVFSGEHRAGTSLKGPDGLVKGGVSSQA